MTKTTHFLFIGLMAAITVVVTAYLSFVGYSYYQLPIEERFYHPQYDWFKPSGAFGHGLGIVGTLMILFGVTIYIARKRYGFMERFLRLRYLLEFHIFLCTLGPILVLFHTSFKFGGIVSIAFWSMVAVVASGVVGRFIYIQIPRNIQGHEIGRDQLIETQQSFLEELKTQGVFNENEFELLLNENTDNKGKIAAAKSLLKSKSVNKAQRTKVISVLKAEYRLGKRIRNLNRMQTLFKYWHVAHLPFALIMLIIVVVHVAVTLMFGYKWIF